MPPDHLKPVSVEDDQPSIVRPLTLLERYAALADQEVERSASLEHKLADLELELDDLKARHRLAKAGLLNALRAHGRDDMQTLGVALAHIAEALNG